MRGLTADMALLSIALRLGCSAAPVAEGTPAAPAASSEDRGNEKSSDTQAIRKHVEDYVQAYNSHRVEAMDALLTDDIDTIVLPGKLLEGKAALHELFVRRHSSVAQASRLSRTVERIRFLTADIALVDGQYEATGMKDPQGNRAPPLKAWITETLRKDLGKWRTVVFRAIPLPATQSGSAPITGDASRAQDDESAIRRIWTKYEEAWNRHDSKALANFYAEDGDAVFPSGLTVSGRAAVETAEAKNHSTINRSSHTTRTIQAFRLVTPDVALVDGSVEITGMLGTNGESLPSRRALMTTLFVKRSGAWWIAANRAMVPTPSGHKAPASSPSE